MKTHHKTIAVIAVVVLILAVVYFKTLYRLSYQVSGSLEKEESLTILYADQDRGLDIESTIWDKIEPVKVKLFPQSARTSFGRYEREIMVRGVYNEKDMAILVEYPDETESRTGLVKPDSSAVLFVPGDSPAVSQMMGFESKANIWQWSASRDMERYFENKQNINPVKEMVAVGPTTQAAMEMQNVTGRGIYENSRWRVLYIRKMAKQQKDDLELGSDTKVKIAFAVWDGERLETFSRKSISILRNLVFGEK